MLWVVGAGGGAFAIYDVAADSVIYDDYLLAPSEIHVEITPDGRYGFGTGAAYVEPFKKTVSAPKTLMVFDIPGNRVLAELSTELEIDGEVTNGFSPLELAVSPDGTWLLTSYGGRMLLLDLRSMEFVDYVDLNSGNALIPDLAIQNGL